MKNQAKIKDFRGKLRWTGDLDEMRLERAFGSVKTSNRPEDFKKNSSLAKEDKAERAVRKRR